jgi:indolepyruvate ferredoxin oxidoreductase alpha subunit
MLEPSDSAECIEYTKLAFELSEKFDTPVFIKTCTRVAHSQSVVETADRVELAVKPYEKNIAKNVMMPGNAKKKHPWVEQRLIDLATYAETSPLNRVEMGDTKLGIITSSTSYQYAKEVYGDQASILKLGMVWPLPTNLIKDFASKVDKLIVIEGGKVAESGTHEELMAAEGVYHKLYGLQIEALKNAGIAE